MSHSFSQAHLIRPVGPEDHSQGPADAPLTLVEYGDFECPSCGQAYPIVQAIQERFGDQLRFVFRNFPLTEIHPHAEHAAEAAEIAGTQGAFWEMHDQLFEHQRALDDHHLVRYAEQIGLPADAFAAALADEAETDRIQADFMSGVRSGVNGTPTFFINGLRFDDSWDEETLSAALEDALVPSR